MRNRSAIRINCGSINPLVVGLLVVGVTAFLYLLTCAFQTTVQETHYEAFQIGKRVGSLATGPSQLVFIKGGTYQLVVDSTDQEEFVEDSQGEQQMAVNTKPTNDSFAYIKNSNDNFLTSYDEVEVTNEAERDETIDYNLNLQDKPEDTTKRNCQFGKPQQDLVLLKTHRTGASSVANIIYRYGDLNNLEFALPKQESYDFYWPLHFNPSFVDRRLINSSHPNALVNARYSRGVMERFMPKATLFLAVLRDPRTHFESVFNSLQLDVILGMENSTSLFEDFLSQPQNIIMHYLRQNKKFNSRLNVARNGESFDLGLLHKHFNDDKMIQKFIEDMSERIDLVLIAEYFDESLVMMKRELCWDLDDVVYFRFHQRGQDYKERNVTEKMNLQIIKWNKADWELYKHFNKTLWEKILKQDSSFRNEVQELRQKIKALEKECISSIGVSEETGEFETILNDKTPSYNRYLCRKMTMSEAEYNVYLKEKFLFKVKEKVFGNSNLYSLKTTNNSKLSTT